MSFEIFFQNFVTDFMLFPVSGDRIKLETKLCTAAGKLWYRYHPGMIRSFIIPPDEGDTTMKNVAFRDATLISLPHLG
jgi:hypothetical protein